MATGIDARNALDTSHRRVIFASSLFAMMSGSVTTLVQLGFTVGVGLLLDTFVVRTLLVPALAYDLGRRTWWPSRLSRAVAAEPASEAPHAREHVSA